MEEGGAERWRIGGREDEVEEMEVGREEMNRGRLLVLV